MFTEEGKKKFVECYQSVDQALNMICEIIDRTKSEDKKVHLAHICLQVKHAWNCGIDVLKEQSIIDTTEQLKFLGLGGQPA